MKIETRLPFSRGPLRLVQVRDRGTLSRQWEALESAVEVIMFTADAHTFEAPHRRLTQPHITVVPKLLGNCADTATLYLTRVPSTLRPNRSFLESFDVGDVFEGDHTVECETDALDHALAELEIDHVDVIQVETPGRELSILEGASAALSGSVFGVEVEIALNPYYEKQPLASEVDSLLRQHGYELFVLTPHRWRRYSGNGLLALGRGQPTWAEALYLRGINSASDAFAALSGDDDREEAVRRAVSICLLYGFADYALEIVDIAVLPIPAARRLRREIRRHDSAASRKRPTKSIQDVPGQILRPLDRWIAKHGEAAAPAEYLLPLTGAQIGLMQTLYERTGIEPVEQIRRAIDAWRVKKPDVRIRGGRTQDIKTYVEGSGLPAELVERLAASPIRLVDVGAANGLQSPWDAVETQLLEVIGFEPGAAAFQALQEAGLSPNFTYINTALSDRQGLVTLYLTKRAGATSVLRPNEGFVEQFDNSDAFDVVGSAVCEADTLDTALALLGKQVDFIKLDTQGSELHILEGATETLRSGVFGVEVEVEFNPLYEQQPLFGDVDLLLRRYGYELFDLNPHVWQRWSGRGLTLSGGQAVWADAVYLKGPREVMRTFATHEDMGQFKAAVLRAVAVCLLYGLADYALDLVEIAKPRLPSAAAQLLTGAIRRYDTEAAVAGVGYLVPVGSEHARRMRKVSKSTGSTPEQQLGLAMEDWLTRHVGARWTRTLGGASAPSLRQLAIRLRRTITRRPGTDTGSTRRNRSSQSKYTHPKSPR